MSTNITPTGFTVGWKDNNDGAYLSDPDTGLTADQVIEQLHHYLRDGATEDWCEFSVCPTTTRHLTGEGA